MFDDEKNPTPSNLPVPPSPEPADLFADSDPVTTPSATPAPSLPESTPISEPAPLPEATPRPEMRAPLAPVTPEESSGKGVFLLVFGVLTVILVVLGVAAFLAYRTLIEAREDEPNVEITIPDLETVEEPIAEVEETPSSTVDTDNDGLTDLEEARYGTDADRSDTDNDGLPDKDEVEKYDTDPIDPDTDGDTFLDGVEVIGGYDPKGPGKLVDLPK